MGVGDRFGSRFGGGAFVGTYVGSRIGAYNGSRIGAYDGFRGGELGCGGGLRGGCECRFRLRRCVCGAPVRAAVVSPLVGGSTASVSGAPPAVVSGAAAGSVPPVAAWWCGLFLPDMLFLPER